MILAYLFLIILSLLISVSSGCTSNFVIPVLFFILGLGLIELCSEENNKKVYSKLFSTAFLVYFAYAVMCYIYMSEHHYNHLLASDSITAYIPWVEDFMKESSLKNMLNLLYDDTETKYSHAGIILLYWTAVGKFSTLFGYELYFNLQVSVLFLSAFVPVFLYRLLVQQEIAKPFKCALIYSFCSVFCFYATLILRDAPIALLYMIAFSYLFSKQSVKKNFVFVSTIVLSYMIRPQMGMFLMLFYSISFITDIGKSNALSIILLIMGSVVISYVLLRLDVIEAMESNALYAELNAAHDEDGLIHKLNRLPPVISDVMKVLYVHISPIPSWAYMGIQTAIEPTYNIMGFPRMLAVLYNYLILGFILYGIINYKDFSFNRQQTFAFLATFLFLALQSSSTEQRRIMICYPLLFLFSVVVFQKSTKKNRENIITISVGVFLLMQLLGALKY